MNVLAVEAECATFFVMGSKYIPSIRDQQAAQRWQKRHNPNLPGFKKKSAPKAGKKRG